MDNNVVAELSLHFNLYNAYGNSSVTNLMIDRHDFKRNTIDSQTKDRKLWLCLI